MTPAMRLATTPITTATTITGIRMASIVTTTVATSWMAAVVTARMAEAMAAVTKAADCFKFPISRLSCICLDSSDWIWTCLLSMAAFFRRFASLNRSAVRFAIRTVSPTGDVGAAPLFLPGAVFSVER